MWSVCGGDSAKYDKQLASRGMRRRQNQALRTADDFEEFVIPHRYECSHNHVWCWGRDGRQVWQALTSRDWARHLYWVERGWDKLEEWPPKYYLKMMRK
jgi:hypothetical protein